LAGVKVTKDNHYFREFIETLSPPKQFINYNIGHNVLPELSVFLRTALLTYTSGVIEQVKSPWFVGDIGAKNSVCGIRDEG
jgi:hypothetical protein